ncbi:MAG: anti-sigma factor antagonist [Clostridia bacterium]|nr:anti-sigma factor antagonist [Clostridia bacterium]
MKEISITKANGEITIALSGRIDSNNARDIESKATAAVPERSSAAVVIDMENLEYISSAGLRVILRLKKNNSNLRLINVSTEVYDILDMTGFTEMMPVEKAYRVVSIEGCEEIGRGANGTIYRIDKDNVVKVYNNADALADIQHEREVAKLALILGIPTAISYDVVKVGQSYGSVFELLNARSFSKILSTEPDRFDWCVKEYVEMLKKIHSTVVPKGKLPDMKETVVSWARFMKDYLPKESGDKLLALVEAVPHDDHMIHGDYHTKNLELQSDEVLLIDMDTLAVGHPVFELASIFNAFIGFSELNHEIIKKFQGFNFETGNAFWRASLAAYLGTDKEEIIRKVEDKARIIGYTRLLRRSIRRGGLESETGKAEIEHWTKELIELLSRTDSLLFTRNEFEIEAANDNLPLVLSFMEKHLEELDCSPKTQMQINVAVEEIFVNIANYAYYPGHGKTIIRVEPLSNPKSITITLIDEGKPFDPTKKPDPDIMLSANDREIGGLGIFMTKKIMDEVNYVYLDGQNILTMKKFFV